MYDETKIMDLDALKVLKELLGSYGGSYVVDPMGKSTVESLFAGKSTVESYCW